MDFAKDVYQRAVAVEVVAQRCSVKKVFLKISQVLGENICAGVSFLLKLQAWTPPVAASVTFFWNAIRCLPLSSFYIQFNPHFLFVEKYYLGQCLLLIGVGLKPEDKILLQKNWALHFSFSFQFIMNIAESEIRKR